MAYTRLKPKSFHNNQVLSTFELVLFHVIKASINCYKGSHYPHLLIYLIN